MTIKETLYKRFLELENELFTLKGNANNVRKFNDDYFNSYSFKREAQAKTIESLKKDIAITDSKLEYIKFELRRNAFFETEDGQKYKADIEGQIEKEVEKRQELRSSATEGISSIIKSLLGDDWYVDDCGRWMHIRFQKDKHIYDFSVDYDPWSREDNFRMNYSSYGAFDLLNDEVVIEYLAGIGKFVSDKKATQNIMNIMKDFLREYEESTSIINELKDKLVYPEPLTTSQNER